MADLLYNSQDKTFRSTLGSDNDEVIIGNKDNPLVFEPQIEFTKWGECSLKIKIPDDLITDKTPKVKDNKTIEIGDSKTGFYFNRFDDESFKFGLILKETPSNDKLVTIDGVKYYQWQFKLVGWENFDFFKIPELNYQGEKIPEGISGNYNIFHKIKKGNQYKNGCIGYFCKPKFIDKDKNIQYSVFEITKEGIYKVSLLKDWADKAVYPILANDEFGNHAGTPNYDKIGLNSGNVGVGKFTMPAGGGSVTKLTAYMRDNTANGIKGVIFDDDGTSAAPLTLLGVTGAINPTDYAEDWYDLTFASPVVLAAGDYYLGVISAGTSIWFYYSATSGGTYKASIDNNYTTPVNWNATSDSGNLLMDIYATYTPSGGGTPMPFPTTGYLDQFNRSNDTHPVTGWSDTYNGWDLVSNAFKGSAVADYSVSYWNAGTFTNCEGYFTITTKNIVNNADLYIEWRVANPANEYGYVISIITNSLGTDHVYLGYQDSGGLHTAQDISQEISDGDSIGFSSIGSTHQVWYKASGGSWTQIGTDWTDSTYTSAGYIQLSCSGTVWVIDDFGGGTVVSASQTKRRKLMMVQ